MPLPPRFLKTVRLAHLYLGVFVAPAVLFFAITGALQTFSLHETTPGSSYRPPHIFVVLGQIHKKQTPILPTRNPPPPAPGSERHNGADKPSAPVAPKPPAPETTPKHNPYPLKIFFLLVAISLCLSTFTGIYMAWAYSRNKTAIATLLVLGTVIPTLMILL